MCFFLRGFIVFNRIFDLKKVYNGFSLFIVDVDDGEFLIGRCILIVCIIGNNCFYFR